MAYAVELDKVKAHLGILESDFDDELLDYISAATLKIEKKLRRKLIQTSVTETIDDWPVNDCIVLRWSPVSAVSSITYVDADEVTQTLSTDIYQVDTTHDPTRIVRVSGQTWPTLKSGYASPITITYTAGYGTASSDVPADVQHALKLTVAHWVKYREPVSDGRSPPVIPKTVDWLLGSLRVPR